MAENKETGPKVTIQGNMHLDRSPVAQPEGTSRFVLNGVNQTNEGEEGFLSTEEANEASAQFPNGFIPLGSTPINNNKTVVFLANGVDSIIGVVDEVDIFTISVDDRGQTDKLGFRLDRQIDALFRLRRGCETTIYWVDPKPRKVVLERPDKFKNDSGEWNIPSFNLFREIQSIPKFTNVEVSESGGVMAPGSYVFTVQYLDSDFNPSEFISTIGPVRIYSDRINQNFREIKGSSTLESPFYSPESTGKAVTLSMSGLDTETYPFYRVAISEVNTGRGLISSVKYSEPVPTSVETYTYTGANSAEDGTVEEVELFSLIIQEATSIDQIDNILTLTDTRGLDVDLCKLQRYASQITADVVTKRVKLSIPEGANSKNPTSAIEGLGYMPGEIYSIGIVYIIEGNYFSPVYHVPGKSALVDSQATFVQGENIYGMSTNNEAQDSVYTDNSTCSQEGSGLWGLDSQGTVLKNEKIRHHRFPFRSEVGLKLFEQIEEGGTDETDSWQIELELYGTLDLPECPADEPDCVIDLSTLPNILYEIFYGLADETGTLIPGSEQIYSRVVVYEDWDNFAASDETPPDNPTGVSGTPSIVTYTSSEITNNGLVPIKVKETIGEDPSQEYTFNAEGLATGASGITYYANPIESQFTIEGPIYETEVMGINFSNVKIPTPDQIGGKKIVGYFFVRNERTEQEKTVLDTAILTPSIISEKFVSHAYLFPEFDPGDEDKLDNKVLGMVNPEFKFNDKTYSSFDKIVLQGEYEVNQRTYSRFRIEDVVDGTTYNKDRHKSNEEDKDGWDLHVRTKQNKVSFSSTPLEVIADKDNINDVFYLNPLDSKRIDGGETSIEYFNLASDNKIGVIELETPYLGGFSNKVPYVSLLRSNLNPYSAFRSSRYIKVTNNFHEAVPGEVYENQEFGGDTYVSSVNYINSVFYNEKPRKRRTKSGIFSFIGGALLVIAGAVLIATGIGAVAGGVLIGIGATIFASGLEREAFNRAYSRLYDEGLRDTVKDGFALQFEEIVGNPDDDEYQWLAESTDIFFETSVNIGLRHGANKGSAPDFMPSPALIESGNSIQGKNTVPAITALDRYMVQKLTYLDNERKEEARAYIGFALPEIYVLNKDYSFENTQKVYEHLPIEYDCCSDCLEEFPHRIHYSVQSFEEELTDNFGVFLPNNYKDIEGGTGRIVDTFTIGTNLYLVTEHAIWHQPQQYQERVTGDIVSFIGTGSYFSTPPKKIVDGDTDSAGTSYKWGVKKTKHGVLIVSDREKKIYLFNGRELQPISDHGLSNFFRNNIQSVLAKDYYIQNNAYYPYIDVPSNPIGVGYTTAYDSTKDRFLITKKDFSTNIEAEDYRLCHEGSGTIIFENFTQLIADRAADGYTFLGFEGCQLKFSKEVIVQEEQTTVIDINIPATADIIVWLDTSGSFGPTARSQIIGVILSWRQQFMIDNNWSGELIFLTNTNDALEPPIPGVSFYSNGTGGTSELWLDPLAVAKQNIYNGNLSGKDIVLVSFVNETSPSYHGTSTLTAIEDPASYPAFGEDRAVHIENYESIIESGGSFTALLYPIVFVGTAQTKSFLLHALAAIKSSSIGFVSYRAEDFDLLTQNPAFSDQEWADIKGALSSNNPYLVQGIGSLDQYGWSVVTTNSWNPPDDVNPPVSQEQFNNDITIFLQGISESEEQTVFVDTLETVIDLQPGTPIEVIKIDHSYTLSYSLKTKGWVSFHSYLPSFYLTQTEKFYSWFDGNPNLWLHNVKGKYREFYGEVKPFIVEFVSNTSPVATKVWDFIMYQGEASFYDEESDSFIDVRDKTFNKAIFYNSYQTTGNKNLVFKVNGGENYMLDQITNNINDITVDRNERDFTLNNIRDYRKNMTDPMFKTKGEAVQSDYYIDKVVNEDNVDLIKDWTELESFRDKYLVIRLIFDNLQTDTKLTMHFSMEDIKLSQR